MKPIPMTHARNFRRLMEETMSDPHMKKLLTRIVE